jgi:hypothetical protein
VDYNKARATGGVTFEIDPKARFSRFVLKVGSGEPATAAIDLGTYVHPDDREDDFLQELINEEKILRLPSGWPLVQINDVYSTNIVPAGDLVSGSDDLGNELCERLAARTARVIPQGCSVWPWRVNLDEHDRSRMPLALTNQQLSDNTDRIAADLTRLHGVEIVDECSHDDTVILAFFHTNAFSNIVRSSGSKGLAVFGFSGVEADITPVVDLRTLWREPIVGRLTLMLRRKLLSTATVPIFQKHRLQHLGQGRQAQRDEPRDFDEELHSDVQIHAQRALRRGFFLNSEPRLIEYWIEMKILGFGQDLLLQNAGKAVRAIRTAANLDGPVLVVNMIGGLAHEFELNQPELRPSNLDLNDDEAIVVNIGFDANSRPTVTSPPSRPLGGAPASAILLTPIDTYVGAHAAVTSWLAAAEHEIIGIVPLISAAAAHSFDAHDWQADFLPVLRLAGDDAVLHRRLREDK